tara:strand:- start:26139 stop:26855 length:717 start_codon:yes stop_codon:yes gene_type:complete
MLQKVDLTKVLFLDIETVPEKENFDQLSNYRKELCPQKSAYQRKEEETPETFNRKAGIWAEFGKIVCISVGYFIIEKDLRNFRIKTFFGEEKQLPLDFKALLDIHFSLRNHVLCSHNGKEFDFPFIARRMIIQSIDSLKSLNLFGKKPWEIPHIDTMHLWCFGDFKHYTSLKLLAEVLGIPSPKDDIDESEVAHVFYVDKNIARILTYCEKDIVTIALVILQFKNEPLLESDEIIWLN